MLKPKIYPKSLLLAVAVAAATLFFYHNRTYTKEEIDRWFKPITSKYGIKIVYDVGPDFLSPLTNAGIPVGPNRDSVVVPIDHKVLARCPHILHSALEKYPVKVIKENLNAIYFAKEIDSNGLKCGGSYDPFRRVIYLTNNGMKSQKYLVATLHHELSSLFLSRSSFLLNNWLDQNTKGFRYLYDDKDFTLKSIKKKNKDTLTGSANDYNKGFMNIYGQTNFENDFNEYAAMIFTYPQKFKKIMNQYPRVRVKFLIFLDFYHRIDPIFTEEYLLGEKQTAASKAPVASTLD